MGHSYLPPSAGKSWSTCYAWPHLNQASTFSNAADEGTCAHAVLANVCVARFQFGMASACANDHIGKEIDVAEDGEEPRLVTVDGEMVVHVQSVVDYVAQRVEEMGPGTKVYVEQRVDPAPLFGLPSTIPDGPNGEERTALAGTADLVLTAPNGDVEVIDLKYGRGVVVEVHDGGHPFMQGMLYLAGACADLNVPRDRATEWRLTIAQPRAWHPDGPIRSTGVTDGDMALVSDRVTRSAEAIFAAREKGTEDQLPRSPTPDGCRFCQAKPRCRAYLEFMEIQTRLPLTSDTLEETITDPNAVSDAEAINILDNADLLRQYITALEDRAVSQLHDGTASPALRQAFKLVAGRSVRRWAYDEPETVESALRKIRWKDPATEKSTGLKKSEFMVQKLRSPSQIETELKRRGGKALTKVHWDAFKRLVTKPEGALTLAPASDPRQPAKDPATMFQDVPDAPSTTATQETA